MSDLQRAVIERMKSFEKRKTSIPQYGLVLRSACEDKALVLSADTASASYSPTEEIWKLMPDSFVNTGIAEQNLVGIACGLAREGFVPFVQTTAVFLTTRAYEFIRNMVAHERSNVKLLGYASGLLRNGNAGYSHWCTEDISLMKNLPNITILCPSDVFEVAKAVALAYTITGPVYIRIPIPYWEPLLGSTKKLTLKSVEKKTMGIDVAVVTYGYLVKVAGTAVKGFEDRVGLIEFAVLKPLAKKTVLSILRTYKSVIVYEEHMVHGSLYLDFLQIANEAGLATRIVSKAISREHYQIGGPEELLKAFGLGELDLRRSIKRELKEPSSTPIRQRKERESVSS